MIYEVGTHIDLTYLNQKRKVPAEPLTTTVFDEADAETESRSIYDVGTQFRFMLTPAGLKATRHIQVMTA